MRIPILPTGPFRNPCRSTPLVAVILAACGGGGGSSGSNEPVGPGTDSNQAPTITGSPATTIGATNAYSFMPAAGDADGDPLTFEIRNRPPWASFDIATGALTGTPSDAEAGIYMGIQILVSDGKAQVSLPPFDITVSPIGSRSVTLVWHRPTHNTDGSVLADLSGYVLRYGTSPDQLISAMNLPSPEQTTAVVSSLTMGTWYFALVSVNSSGVESEPVGPLSTEVL